MELCDDIIPDLHWSEVFPRPPLGHCDIFDSIHLRPEFWGRLVFQVYALAAVYYHVLFPVEVFFSLIRDTCSIILSFGGCGVLA